MIPSSRVRSAAVAAGALVLVAGCSAPDPTAFTSLADAPRELSAYGLFAGDAALQVPAEGVVPYDLTTPLFSDYAEKLRFVKLPEGTTAAYHEVDAFDFPVGTIIAKTFAYPIDERDPSLGLDLLETRILARLESGWIGLPYVWNEEETEATLRVAGGMLEASWIDATGAQQGHDYLVPNANQCKGCHEATEAGTGPLGPKARFLNRDYAYVDGVRNQLAHWSDAGILSGAATPAEAPLAPAWTDADAGSLDARARGYLDVNCAHCHNPEGPARTTGLDLGWTARNPVDLGVYKFPVAAGRGSGDRLFGIVPGEPEASIMIYRMESLDAGVMMPELGRRMVHTEGIELLREWIAEMPEPEGRPRPATPAG